jgi:hypothetical protein
VTTQFDQVERRASAGIQAAGRALTEAQSRRNHATRKFQRACADLYAGTGSPNAVEAAEREMEEARRDVARAAAAKEYWAPYGPQRLAGT